MTARIVLVRHAEPARSARGRAIGRTDVGLSRKGARQARELASNLAATGVDRVVSSPCMRAIRTAEPIARACGAPLEVDADLREIDFGAFDGRTFASIEREHPGLYATWMRAPTAVVFPDGETWPALRERAERAIERIAKTGEGRTTVAVTHLGVILATLGRVLPVVDEDVFRLTIEHAHTSWLDVDDGYEPRTCNDVAALAGEKEGIMMVTVEDVPQVKVGTKGVLIRIRDGQGKNLGKLWIGSAHVRWAQGSMPEKNAKSLSVKEFVNYLNAQ